MENITIRRISMGKIGPTPWMYPTAAGSALLLGLTYGEKPPARRRGMPLFRNVTIEDIDVVSAGMAGRIEGLPEDCLEGLTLRNVEVKGGNRALALSERRPVVAGGIQRAPVGLVHRRMQQQQQPPDDKGPGSETIRSQNRIEYRKNP
eukprot:CAMPEP_0172386300 /NCGR_PEP_ID=MMETSP1061-20121228/3876_1 /TAXON_ID=37318 /ORGANISM="Pseudo-nitzschia pungens, Strain cf. pungens" /LENGTH=147 /DNA_ID=CAMNT_0013115643 /DNA_START=398 /DNA_END=840 /DNA_ORIENTATION=+